MNKYSVLVSSCDAYKDLWDPFFYFLNNNWPELKDKEIVLNTEKEKYTYKNLKILTFSFDVSKEEYTWSKRLKLHLEKIEKEYVLLLLDDFFVESEVLDEKINFCVNEMEKDKNIVHFGFVPTLWENIDDNRYCDFELRKRNSPFRVNTQAGLWRRSEIIALIREHESPWDFEVFASIRSRLRKGKYYVAKSGEKQVFNYDWFNGGAVHRGKWTESAVKLLNKHNINIDLEKRGFDDLEVLKPEDIPLKPLEKNIFGRTIIRLKVLLKNWKSLI